MNDLGDIAIVHVAKLRGNGQADLVAASPHGYGMWRWELQDEDEATRTYSRVVLEDRISQLHALRVVECRFSPSPVVIAGKRWQAHGPDGDVDAAGTPFLFMVLGDPSWSSSSIELIDDSSGVGLAFDTALDADGRLLIATANKRGAYLFREGD